MGGPAPATSADVVVIGRANIDLTVRVPHRPAPGQAVFGSELMTTAGGKGLNQAVTVARLGGRACLVANAGDDQWGQQIRTTLTEAGVDITHFRLVPGAPTGAAIIEVTPDGENSLVVAVSPETELRSEQVQDALTRTSARVIVIQLDLPPQLASRALSASQQESIRVGNLAPHPAFDLDLMNRFDALVVNQHEAARLLDTTDADPLAAARQLRRLGPAIAVVTAGPDGAAYAHPDGSDMIPAPRVPVLDTTGAGDAFLGCLALHLARNLPLPDAVTRAVQVGAQAVQHAGAHMPT
jgi:ribokinase